MVLDGAIRFGLDKSAVVGKGRGRTQRGSDNVDPKMRIGLGGIISSTKYEKGTLIYDSLRQKS
jgi:hypothetical protein